MPRPHYGGDGRGQPMPLWKCRSCGARWEGGSDTCTHCGGPGDPLPPAVRGLYPARMRRYSITPPERQPTHGHGPWE